MSYVQPTTHRHLGDDCHGILGQMVMVSAAQWRAGQQLEG